MTGNSLQSPEKIQVLDIPPGWGNTKEEFKERVMNLIKQKLLGSEAPKFEITNPDGSKTPFYPILCAVSPEWNVISREEMAEILYPRFVKIAYEAQVSATREYADHIWGTKYLAWGLKQGIFSENEVGMIRFDGDTPESYIREYCNVDLIEDYIERLIHPRSQVPIIRKQVISQVNDCYLCCH